MNIIRTSLVKVIQGQGRVKFQLAWIGLKLGENKYGHDGSKKWTLRTSLVKVIQGQGRVKFQLALIGLKLGENKMDMMGVWNEH